jgi:hypothetical protein
VREHETREVLGHVEARRVGIWGGERAHDFTTTRGEVGS